MRGRHFAVIGALLIAIGVAIGAYHAHGLKKLLVRKGLEPVEVQHLLDNTEVAIRYQMYHALGLLALGCFSAKNTPRLLTIGCFLVCLGMLGFSGGLYVLVFAGPILHWAVIPAGGVILILAWVLIAIALASAANRAGREPV